MLFEAKTTYYIANRDGSFLEVPGTKLSGDLFAYKHDLAYFGWCITDTKSGMLIKNKFKTLKDCKDYVANMPEEDKEKIEKARQESTYLDQCDKLNKFKNKDNYSLFDFNEAYDELSKEQDQLEL